MKKLAFIFISYFLLTIAFVSAQTKQMRRVPIAPFQGIKHYCSAVKPVQYDVTIKGAKVTDDPMKPEANAIKAGTIKSVKTFSNQ